VWHPVCVHAEQIAPEMFTKYFEAIIIIIIIIINSIQEESKNRLKSGNVGTHSMKNLFCPPVCYPKI